MSLINKVKEHYYKIPNWVLKIIGYLYYLIPEKIRYGSTFSNTTKILQDIEFQSKEQVESMIDEKFVKIVRYAYEHVPFYRRYYDEYGVDISTIKSVKDISKLPFIDKNTVKQYADEMISDDVDKKRLIYVTTSGSTGDPVGFYQPQEMTMTEWAYTLHIWRRVGYRPDSSRLVLRGKKLHPGSKNSNYFYDPLRRELSCNIFDMREETMEEYCKAIEKYKPEFIHGYMSAIFMLAKYIDLKRGKLKHHFKAILATSENIIQEQKEYVEKVFESRVFSFYGHSERLIIAGECEKSSSYHCEPSYGYCEILNEDGLPDKNGEIVATGFLNYAMPLIRYKTGDMAIADNECCECGRSTQIIKSVIGRWHQDMLVNRDGAYVSLTAINIHSKEFDRVIRYKIIQDQVGKVLMKIQPSDSFSNSDIKAIKRLLEEKTNYKIEFKIEVVDNIPLLSNGKYRIVEQNLIL